MKANEMNVWDLGKGRGEWEWSRVNPDGKWVTYSDAMQVIQALEAKIKGMIERPTVEVVEVNEWGEVFHCVAVNDRRLFLNSYKQNDTDTTVIASDVAQLVCDDLTKALVGGEG